MKVTLILDMEEACKHPGTSEYLLPFQAYPAHSITPLLGFSDLSKTIGNSLETIKSYTLRT